MNYVDKDVLKRVREVFPSCPMCLSEDFAAQVSGEEKKVIGRKFLAVVRCKNCKALWKLEEYAGFYVTLVEKGVNPHKLDVRVGKDRPIEFWSQLRGDVEFRVSEELRLSLASTSERVYFGCPYCHTIWKAVPRPRMTCVDDKCRRKWHKGVFRVLFGRVADSKWCTWTYGDESWGEEFVHPSKELGTDAVSAWLTGSSLGKLIGFPYSHFLLKLSTPRKMVTLGLAVRYEEIPIPTGKPFRVLSPTGERVGDYRQTLDLKKRDVVSISFPPPPQSFLDKLFSKLFRMHEFLVNDRVGRGWKIKVEREKAGQTS